MKEATKPSNINDKFMECNKSRLPKNLCAKIAAVENNILQTEQKAELLHSSLVKKGDPDKKRVEELSAKEQESRRKFKEKLNKLKKMPMSTQPTINVTSEGLTEESLPSATPDLEKPVEKKQNVIKVCMGTKPIDSAIYRFACVLPIKGNAQSTRHKDIGSMICKSVGLIPEQDVNNEQFVFLSKDKQKSGNTSSGAIPSNQKTLLPMKQKETTTENKVNKELDLDENRILRKREYKKPVLEKNKMPELKDNQILDPPKDDKLLDLKENTVLNTKESKVIDLKDNKVMNPKEIPKPIETTSPPIKPTEPIALPPKEVDLSNPTIDLAPYDRPNPKNNETKLNNSVHFKPHAANSINYETNSNNSDKILNHPATKEKTMNSIKTEGIPQEHLKEPPNVRGGILSNLLKSFALEMKGFNPKTWFSGKGKDQKMKMIPFPSVSKMPLRWRQGVIFVGTFIPLYYTYHKIVTNKELTLKLAQES